MGNDAKCALWTQIPYLKKVYYDLANIQLILQTCFVTIWLGDHTQKCVNRVERQLVQVTENSLNGCTTTKKQECQTFEQWMGVKDHLGGM